MKNYLKRNKGNDKEKGSQQPKNGKKKIIIVLAVVIGVIFFSSYMFIKNGEVQPKYDGDGNPIYVEDGEEGYIYSDTRSYLGQFVDLGGQVFGEPESDGDVTTLQIWGDPENAEKNTIVYYNGTLDIQTDDYVVLTGYIFDILDYENAFGGKVSAPVVVATKLEKVSYADVLAPTLKEVSYTDKTINQQNYIIQVTKVEFAEKETRVYVTAKNDAKDDFSIYTYGAVLTQNGKQYEQEFNYSADYEELSSELKPGISSSGILVFPKIEQKDFMLLVDGYSNNWNIDLGEYKFDLTVE